MSNNHTSGTGGVHTIMSTSLNNAQLPSHIANSQNCNNTNALHISQQTTGGTTPNAMSTSLHSNDGSCSGLTSVTYENSATWNSNHCSQISPSVPVPPRNLKANNQKFQS